MELSPAAYMQLMTVWAGQHQYRVFGEVLLYCIHLHTNAPASNTGLCTAAQPKATMHASALLLWCLGTTLAAAWNLEAPCGRGARAKSGHLTGSCLCVLAGCCLGRGSREAWVAPWGPVASLSNARAQGLALKLAALFAWPLQTCFWGGVLSLWRQEGLPQGMVRVLWPLHRNWWLGVVLSSLACDLGCMV